MSVTRRLYNKESGPSKDFFRVHDFLVRINRQQPIQWDFEWSRWEWAMYHGQLDAEHLNSIAFWENERGIVALATYEDVLGRAYLVFANDDRELKAEVFQYAKQYLRDEEGRVKILINNTDAVLQHIALSAGFVATQESEGNAVLDINHADLNYELPDGFIVSDLATTFDLRMFHRLMWRGFDHPEPVAESDEELRVRDRMVSQPHINRSLHTLILTSQGDYCAYCGIWYNATTRYAVIEPLVTHPDYRQRGLGRAVVLASVRKCADLGAACVYVGSSQQFYYQLGFRPLPNSTFWQPK